MYVVVLGQRRLVDLDAPAGAVRAQLTSLTPARLSGEMTRTINQARLFAAVLTDGAYLDASIDHATASTPDLRRTRVPVGPVAVFGASNFPLAFSVPGGDTVSALAAGCPVVVKVHPGHPLTSVRSLKAMSRAVAHRGLPQAVLGLIAGFAAGRDVVLDPASRPSASPAPRGRVGRCSTSRRRGRSPSPSSASSAASTRSSSRPRRPLARGPHIADTLATSISGSAGQLCTKPNLLFVPTAEGDELVNDLAAALRAVPRRCS